MVAAAVHGHVGVHVTGDRGHDPCPVPRVLQHARLLDVHLDPAREVVEHVARLAPAGWLVAGLLRVLPEAAAVVDRAEVLAKVVLGHPLGHDPAAEQHLPEAGALFLEEGDQLQRQAEAELLVQPAHLERGDDPHRAVVLAAVAVRVAVRADPEHLLALRPVACHERADRVLADVVPDRLELTREVVERVAVCRRVGIAANRLVRDRELGACQRLDVALDPRSASQPVDGRGPDAHRDSLRRRMSR